MKKIITLAIIVVGAAILILLYNQSNEENSALNLSEFSELTREDPLFYSPFFAAKEFEAAADALQKSEARALKTIMGNIESAGFRADLYLPVLKTSKLFPDEFLKSLVSINQKTEEFLASPSGKLAYDLLALYDEAASQYLETVSSQIEALAMLEPYLSEEELHLFIFADSVSSFEIVKSDLLTIQENGKALQEEIARRKNCISAKGSCEPQASRVNTKEFLASLNAKFDLTGPVIDFVKSNLAYSPSAEEVKGPYQIESACWQSPDTKHWLYVIYSHRGGQTIVLPKLATQNYYITVSPDAADAINAALRERGLQYYSQPETTTYECIDLTFYPRLLVLDFLAEQIKTGRVSPENLETDPAYIKLIENQFGLLAPAINALASHIDLLEASQRLKDARIFPPEYLFTTRSAYSILYFPYSRSIWRIDKQLEYALPEEQRKRILSSSRFMTLDSLLEKNYSYEEIQKFHVGQSDLIHSLLEDSH